ncbi:MAG: Npt1/Npt2 family nucleotide transporter [Planctomycetota bacterium]
MAEGGNQKASTVFAAAAIAVSAFFLLCGYELVRSTSNTLFNKAYGNAGRPAVNALVPVGLIAMLYVYARLLSWLGPRRTLLVTTLGSAAGIVACYFAVRGSFAQATRVLYILREGYIVLLIEQYWSFLNSTLGTNAAKKLNGPICGVASLGAVLGGKLVFHLSARLGTATLLLLGAAACVPAAVCSEIAYRRCGEPRPSPLLSPAAAEGKKHDGHLGLGLFRSQRMLVFLLATIVATQVLCTALELSFQGILQDEYPESVSQNTYSGDFFATLNAAAALGQFVMAPLLLRWVALDAVHFALPLANAVACVCLLAAPSLESAGVAYLLFKALDYSLFRTAKELLYIPHSFDVRYRAKELIDVLGYRCGKGGCSLIIALLQKAHLVFTAGRYALIGIAAAGVWLAAQ